MTTPSIEKLDRNFQTTLSDDPLEWFDAFDARFALCGLGWRDEACAERSFHRFPSRLMPNLPEAVQHLGKCPSSVYLAFETDATDLTIRFKAANPGKMAHMPLSGSAGTELLMEVDGEWLQLRSAIPGFDTLEHQHPLLENRPAQRRRFRIYLPLYRALEEASIGVNPGATVNPTPSQGRPTVVYGTSITQGGCASTAGTDFVSLLGMKLGVEMLNFGFSGNGKGEKIVAEALSEIDAEMFVLDYVANVTSDQLAATLPGFYETLRARHPQTPIVLITKVGYNRVLFDSAYYKEEQLRRDVMMRFYLQCRDAGDQHVYLIDGQGVLPNNTTGAYVDGVHPTTAGFVQMAERLAPQLRTIRFIEGLI